MHEFKKKNSWLMLSLISWERRPGSSDDKTKLRGSGRGQIHTQARLTPEPLGYYA